MGFSFQTTGDLSKTKKFLARASNSDYLKVLEHYGAKGVSALSSATPKDSGNTAGSWNYSVNIGRRSSTITWTNSKVTSQGTSVAIMLQYGHGTGTGGYVRGRDYINPAMSPVFDDIADAVWKAVKNL